MAKQQKISKHSIPEGWSEDAVDFINRVLSFFLDTRPFKEDQRIA